MWEGPSVFQTAYLGVCPPSFFGPFRFGVATLVLCRDFPGVSGLNQTAAIRRGRTAHCAIPDISGVGQAARQASRTTR